jgi:hypothetical protein
MTPAEVAELYQLLNEYGNAKFGDEWWPGNAAVWIGEQQAARLDELTDKLQRGYAGEQARAREERRDH